MTHRTGGLRGLAFAVAILGAGLVAGVAAAQNTTPAPTVGPNVTEQQLLQELNRIQGRVSIPDQRAATLIQPQGRDWRAFRTGMLPWIGGIAIIGTAALLAFFFGYRGRVRIEQGFSGETVERFNVFERFIHWLTAVCFIILALSGLNVTFGRELLLPIIGPEAFTLVSQWAKYAHNFLSVPFFLGVLVMLFMWVRNNIPNGGDLQWIRQGGGMIGRGHPPAHRFNAGQKGIFWSVVLGGLAISISGFLLMFPFYMTDIAGLQTAQIVHAVLGVLMIAVILGHIYIGTLGMQGAYSAMGSGEVDVNWAREHHSLWLDELQRRNAQRGGRPDAPHTAPAE